MMSVANPGRSLPDTTTRMRRLPLLLGLLTACPRPAPPPPPVDARQYSFPETTTPWGRHPGADVCFPTTAPVGWRFGGTHHYDNPAGLDLSWSYPTTTGRCSRCSSTRNTARLPTACPGRRPRP